jgi:hypothetical protein
MATEAKSGTLNCDICDYSVGDDGKKTLNCDGCDLSLKKDSEQASLSSDDKNNLAIAYFDDNAKVILVQNQYLKNKLYRNDNVFVVFAKYSETEYQPVEPASIDVINKLIEEKKLTGLKIQDEFVLDNYNKKTNIEVISKGGSRKPKRKTKKRKTKRRTNKKRYRRTRK